MNNILPLKTRSQRRFTDEAQVRNRRNTPLPQEVGEPFDSRLFWLVCSLVYRDGVAHGLCGVDLGHGESVIREFLLILLGVLIGYFIAGIWPIAGWVLELLRRGM